jgi:hypothetical protein
METGKTKTEEKNLTNRSCIMLIIGTLLFLPGGYFFFRFLPGLFSGAIESTEAIYIYGFFCLSGLAMVSGILLLYFGLKANKVSRESNK